MNPPTNKRVAWVALRLFIDVETDTRQPERLTVTGEQHSDAIGVQRRPVLVGDHVAAVLIRRSPGEAFLALASSMAAQHGDDASLSFT